MVNFAVEDGEPSNQQCVYLLKILMINGAFSRGLATINEALSVRWSVRPSVMIESRI